MSMNPITPPKLHTRGNYHEIRIGSTIYAYSYELFIGRCNLCTKAHTILPNISLTQATQKHIANFKIRHNLEGGKK